MILQPLVLDVRQTQTGHQVKATTSMERVLEQAQTLQNELGCIELDYRATLAAVQAALSAAQEGKMADPRAYWYAGKHLSDFLGRIEARGYYLVGKNTTPAKHLGMAKTSIEKILAFHRRYPDPARVDTRIPWNVYRDHRERKREE